MRIFRLYFFLFFALVACSGGRDDDFAKTLLKHQPQITLMEFSCLGNDNTAVSTSISKNDAGSWTVNNLRPVDDRRWAAWWSMLADVRMRPLYMDTASLPEIIAKLRRAGLHVVAYDREGKVPDNFYIARFDNIGVIALVDGKTYLVDLPYEQETVLSYCSADANFWQDKTVFSCLPADMTAIEVIHCSDSAASFRLVRDTAWSVMDVNGLLQQRFNREMTQRYVSYFQQVEADSLLPPGNRLLEITGDHRHRQHIIRIAGAKANRSVQIFGIPLSSGQGYDTDKCLLYLEDTKETALASWVNFDLMLKNLQDFVDKKEGRQAVISL